MNSLSLYQIAAELEADMAVLAELDLPPEVVADTLEGMRYPLEQKAQNVIMFARNLEASAAAIKEAEAAMKLRREAIERRAEQLREYVKANMERTEISKIECPYFSLAIRTNPPAVEIADGAKVPEQYMVQPPSPPARPDKKLLSAALKAGEQIDGVRLVQTTRLEVK